MLAFDTQFVKLHHSVEISLWTKWCRDWDDTGFFPGLNAVRFTQRSPSWSGSLIIRMLAVAKLRDP